MSAVTLEKTYALLEKLAEYIMNEVPTRKEVDAKLSHLEARMEARMDKMEARLDKLEQKVDKLIEGMDA
jgi:Skp family chaperone for outer membrane proteins